MSTSPCIAAALAFLIIGICSASPIGLLGEWMGQATAHFAIFTRGQDSGGQELLGRLETARLFFKEAGWAARDLKVPLSTLAFPSSKEFETYHFNPAAFAFYQRTQGGDFVMMRALEPEHYSVAVHEYTHFVVERSGLRLPLWLNEGLADFYSTLQYRNAQAIVGLPPDGRERSLRGRDWLDWRALAAVDRNSPYYREPDKMLAFYAQSWALVHTLALDPAYAGKFQSFLLAISGRTDSEQVISATYQKSLDEIGREVEDSVRSKRLGTQELNIDVRPGALETAPVADSDRIVEFALADVQAVDPHLMSEARERLAALNAKYPEDPHSEESLGFLAMRTGANGEAEEHFGRAVKAGSKKADVLFMAAHLRVARGDTGEEVMNLLKRVVAMSPNHYNALLELGFAATKNEEFELAVDVLTRIKEPKSEHDYSVTYNIAYCLSELQEYKKALSYAEQAVKKAMNSRDKEEAQRLLLFISEEAKRETATN